MGLLHRARCHLWLQMLRLVADAESQVIHMDMPVIVFLGSLPRARCRQWLQTLRPVTGAKSQVIHLDTPDFAFASLLEGIRSAAVSED